MFSSFKIAPKGTEIAKIDSPTSCMEVSFTTYNNKNKSQLFMTEFGPSFNSKLGFYNNNNNKTNNKNNNNNNNSRGL